MHLVGFLSALSSREGPVGPWIQGIPGKFDSRVFFLIFFFKKPMKMVDEDGWILEFRAENDTK